MTANPQAYHPVYDFLCLSRRQAQRLLFAQQLCRALFWAGLPAVVLMYCRHYVGLETGGVIAAWLLAAAAGASVLSWRRHLEVGQVLSELDLSSDRHDNLATATEFLADPDPFRQLAVRQTEKWLAAHREEIRCLWRWPREARLLPAILIGMILAWWLAPKPMAEASTPPPVDTSARVSPPPARKSKSQPASMPESSPASQPTSSLASQPTFDLLRQTSSSPLSRSSESVSKPTTSSQPNGGSKNGVGTGSDGNVGGSRKGSGGGAPDGIAGGAKNGNSGGSSSRESGSNSRSDGQSGSLGSKGKGATAGNQQQPNASKSAGAQPDKHGTAGAARPADGTAGAGNAGSNASGGKSGPQPGSAGAKQPDGSSSLGTGKAVNKTANAVGGASGGGKTGNPSASAGKPQNAGSGTTAVPSKVSSKSGSPSNCAGGCSGANGCKGTGACTSGTNSGGSAPGLAAGGMASREAGGPGSTGDGGIASGSAGQKPTAGKAGGGVSSAGGLRHGLHAGKGHVAPLGTGQKTLSGKVQAIDAKEAKAPSGDVPREVLGQAPMDDPNAPIRPSATTRPVEVDFDTPVLGGSEFESLPPARRALVLRYFRTMRAVTASQPVQENNP